MMSDIAPRKLLSLAERAALEAGRVVTERFTQPRQIKNKGYRDLVTDADLAAQETITQLIRTQFPEHGFLTEEDDPGLPNSGPIIWVIDPVDGTTNYSHQIPTYSVSIAAIRNNNNNKNMEDPRRDHEVLAGVVYDPPRDELFSAALGVASTLNGNAIRVSNATSLESAVFSLDWSRQPKKRQVMLEVLEAVAHRVHTVRATGSACLSLAWVAAGRFDLYFNLALSPWDVAAAEIIIDQAGGSLSNLQGQAWKFTDSGCLASNGHLHSALLSYCQTLDL
jgi:myo-inositol-1(or 4)-monophosphatase